MTNDAAPVRFTTAFEFTLNEAAWAVLNMSPGYAMSTAEKEEFEAMKTRLVNEAKFEVIERKANSILFPGEFARVSIIRRDDLRRWCQKNGYSPPTLFPEGSSRAASNEGTLSDLERRKVMAILLGMAMESYGYDPDANRNTATGEKAGSIKAALENYDGLSVDNDTIRKYLEEAANMYPAARPRKS